MNRYAVYEDEHLEDASVDNNVNAIFGDFNIGMTLVNAPSMQMQRYDQVSLGDITYFGIHRQIPVLLNPEALILMKTGA